MSLIARGLSVAMRDRKVLHDIAFEARRGEFIVIVGPNGVGKTTLLRAIGGLIPYEGDIAWNGMALATLTAAKRAKLLAYLPQGHVAHWPITARDAVAIGRAPFASSLTGLSREDEAAIDAALEAVEAAPFAGRAITELSGGERARVMLARALAVGAPLLLADEPVASLDPEHQLRVMAVLQQRARGGALVIAVSHDLMLAERFADRLLVLEDGRIAAFAPPRQALTASLLRRVFRIEALTAQAGDVTVTLPWTIAK
jgi:iron complex transport system ATP-binding protein